MTEDLGDVLQKICLALVTDQSLQSEYDRSGKLLRTFCNIASIRAAQAMGCDEFDGKDLLADDLFGIMKLNASGCWKIAGGQEATIHALGGGLGFAAANSAMLNEAHGHIAVIAPLGMQFSNSLGRDVPCCANVGAGDPGGSLGAPDKLGIRRKKNWMCRVSQAFPVKGGEPCYFIYTGRKENAKTD